MFACGNPLRFAGHTPKRRSTIGVCARKSGFGPTWISVFQLVPTWRELGARKPRKQRKGRFPLARFAPPSFHFGTMESRVFFLQELAEQVDPVSGEKAGAVLLTDFGTLLIGISTEAKRRASPLGDRSRFWRKNRAPCFGPPRTCQVRKTEGLFFFEFPVFDLFEVG